MKLQKGVFITLYGINNIGKSTQVKLLAQKLKKDGYDVLVLKYPCYEIKPTGPMLNKFLRQKKNQQHISEEELQMWFTLNRYQFEPRLKQYLSRGKIVIAEDYAGTGIAWGIAKGASEKWLLDLNQYLLKENFSLLLIGDRSFSSREKNHIHDTDASHYERDTTNPFLFQNFSNISKVRTDMIRMFNRGPQRLIAGKHPRKGIKDGHI